MTKVVVSLYKDQTKITSRKYSLKGAYFRRYAPYYAKQDFACFYADLYIIISHLQLNVNRNQEKVTIKHKKFTENKNLNR